jgi:homoserine kinase
MEDRLHQPYRLGLLPAASEMIQAAKQAGAAAAVLSSAGPGVIAFTDTGLGRIEAAMQQAEKDQGFRNQGFLLSISCQGAEIN